MTEIKNVELELARFRDRLFVVGVCIVLALLLLGGRAVVLQIVRHDELAARAEANRTAILPIVPNRGLIVDRNGVVLASNYSAYTLEITPSKVKNMEATLDALAEVVDIQPQHRRRFKRLMEESKRFDSLPIRSRLSDEDVARFSAQRFRFPGVELRARLFRHYPLGETGSHLIGYIGRINAAEKAAMNDWEDEDLANYRGTEYIGKLGVEQKYERQLHGITGYQEVETSAGGRAIRRLNSRGATPGNTVVMSVDSCTGCSTGAPWRVTTSCTSRTTRGVWRCPPASTVAKAFASCTMVCLLYTSPSPRDRQKSRMPSSA